MQRGDTLYAIAFANGLDYREIAIWNQLESADLILVGQVLRLSPPPGAVEIRPLDDEPAPSARPLVESPVLREPQAVLLPYSEANWAQMSTPRPAVAVAPVAPPPAPVANKAPGSGARCERGGRHLAVAGRRHAGWTFWRSGRQGNRHCGAAQCTGESGAPGKVVYSGSGLRGYGQLLIVKHAGEFLSAYAHNESILVKEGDMVAAGQKIALMGDSDADRVKLHFEIRRYGKPLDPLTYLPERS